MKLGAQLYTVRTHLQEPGQIRETFRKVREIGYESVQFSGGSTADAALLQEVSEEFALPIVCTHVPFERLIAECETLIREHKTFACPVIGLGAMPKEYRGSEEGLRAFLDLIEKPAAKILDAGLRFAYHNHAFEFEKVAPDLCYYDLLLEKHPDWQFIADTYWIAYANCSIAEYLEKIGRERLLNVHFKDMAADAARSICACGAGVLQFDAIARQCAELGVQNVLVEQDNAPKLGDPFACLAESYAHLRPIIG